MGNYLSSDELNLEEYEKRRDVGYIWTDKGTKNFDYYNKKRFTKISRKYYPHLYTNGYIYGRYYNDNYYKNIGWIYSEKEGWINTDPISIEREF